MGKLEGDSAPAKAGSIPVQELLLHSKAFKRILEKNKKHIREPQNWICSFREEACSKRLNKHNPFSLLGD